MLSITVLLHNFFCQSSTFWSYLRLLDDYDAMELCLDMFLKTGKATTPHRGRGQRILVKNTRYNSDKENDEDESSSHKMVCLQDVGNYCNILSYYYA